MQTLTYWHSRTVILNLQHLKTSIFKLYSYRCCSCIDTVLHHLFNCICWTVYYFTRSNLVDDMLGQTLWLTIINGVSTKNDSKPLIILYPHLNGPLIYVKVLSKWRRRATPTRPACHCCVVSHPSMVDKKRREGEEEEGRPSKSVGLILAPDHPLII